MREELTNFILSHMMSRGLAVRQDSGQLGGRIVWTKTGRASVLQTAASPRIEAERLADALITIYGTEVVIKPGN